MYLEVFLSQGQPLTNRLTILETTEPNPNPHHHTTLP